MFTGPCRLAEDRKIFNLEIWWHEFQGPRPTILRHTPPKLGELLERCWQQGSSLRPEFSKILNILRHMAKRVWKSSLSFLVFFFFFFFPLPPWVFMSYDLGTGCRWENGPAEEEISYKGIYYCTEHQLKWQVASEKAVYNTCNDVIILFFWVPFTFYLVLSSVNLTNY